MGWGINGCPITQSALNPNYPKFQEGFDVNATNLAKAAYISSTTHMRNDRTTEYDVFRKITNQLRQSDAKKDHPGFVRALHDNRQLWTLLAVDVADKGNRLESGMRAQIFYLAEFTRLHTSKVLAGSETIQALIDINMAVMTGLRQRGDTT